MTFEERELLIARLISGRTRIRVDDKWFTVVEPNAQIRARAAEIVSTKLIKSKASGIQTADESVAQLRKRKIWLKEDDEKLEKVVADIDKLKIAIYESFGRSGDREVIRKTLRAAEKARDELSARKNQFWYMTAEGIGATSRLQFIIGCCLRQHGKRVWCGTTFWKDQSKLLDRAVVAWLAARPSTATLRECARTDPWRASWACKELGSPFVRRIADLSDDQRSLVMWSRIYDQAREDPEGPGDAAEDDDAFDGWLLSRKPKENKKDPHRFTTNEKILASDHIFIPGEAVAAKRAKLRGDDEYEVTAEDYAEIDELNSPGAIAKRDARLKALDKMGVINEMDMPDQKLARQLRVNRGD